VKVERVGEQKRVGREKIWAVRGVLWPPDKLGIAFIRGQEGDERRPWKRLRRG
jgi:hypothetical protein